MKHLGILFFHDFPLDLFDVALTETGAVCDELITVSHDDSRRDMVDFARTHPAVSGHWEDPKPFHPFWKFDEIVKHLIAMGDEPETILFTTQDQLPPGPEQYLAERDEFMASDCDHMMLGYLCTWGNVRTITLPAITTHTKFHTITVKWRPDLSWGPWAGFMTPKTATKAFRAKYPIRHTIFQTPELRGQLHLERPNQCTRKRWLTNDPMPTVPYDPKLTWDEWMTVKPPSDAAAPAPPTSAPTVSSAVETAPEDFEGKIVVILPCRNEGVEIVRTIRDFRKSKAKGTDLHFFVVDDGSTDGCCEILRGAYDITLFRNEEPQGQGRARNLAVLLNLGPNHRGLRGRRGQMERQTPDTGSSASDSEPVHPLLPPTSVSPASSAVENVRGFVSCDAHMRIETQYGMERMVLAAEQHEAVVGTIVNNLDPAHKRWNGCGGKLAWCPDPVPACGSRKLMPAGLRFTWRYRDKTAPVLQPVDLLVGAFYAFTPATYERMGGFIESEGLYGFFEQELALSTWFHNVPRLVATDVFVRHWFRSARPYTHTGAGYWYNYIECLRVMFDDDTFRRVFEPVLLKQMAYAKTDARIQYLLHAPSLADRHAAYMRHRVRTDADALAWIGIEDLTTEATKDTEVGREE